MRKERSICAFWMSPNRTREKAAADGKETVERITFDHYIPVIQKCIEKKIYYIIAPYEADGQIAYLAKNHYVDFVIAKDGDYLVHGCEKLFKSRSRNGKDELYIRSELLQSESLGLQSFNDDMFRYWCILSGCDYFHIEGVGIKRAMKAVKEGKTPKAIFQCLSKICKKAIPES